MVFTDQPAKHIKTTSMYKRVYCGMTFRNSSMIFTDQSAKHIKSNCVHDLTGRMGSNDFATVDADQATGTNIIPVITY
ncbi:MAG: hypothetical protein GX937_04350 [Lentisphaerae bacterium]|nr:hypothetical protein [Lentisphaerota bacterium]